MASVLVLFHRSHLNPRMELFSRALAGAGHDVEALCWDRTGSSNASGGSVPSTRVPGPGFGASLLNLVFLPLVYLRFLSAVVDRGPDLFLCAHISLLPLATVIGILTNTPVIYDIVDPHREEYTERESLLAPVVTVIIKRVERLCLGFVDGITVIDTHGDVLRQRYTGYTENLAVIYNVPELKPRPERGSFGNVIVYAGVVDERKGVSTLLEAFSSVRRTHPAAQLRLVGDSVDDTLARLERRVADLGIADAVTFTGRVNYDTVHDELGRADVAVAPYRRIPMNEITRWNSRKIPDYMNAALPVVMPDFGGFPQLCEATGCGLTVDTTDSEALADALRSLLADPARARELGAQGRVAVETRYNWDREQSKLLRVVETAIARSQRDRDRG